MEEQAVFLMKPKVDFCFINLMADRQVREGFLTALLELPKLKNGNYPESPLLYWAQFINSTKKEEFEMLAKKDPGLGRAYEILRVISADPEKRREYEAREKAIRDYQHQINSYWKRGMKDGYDRGEKVGYENGIQRAKQVWQMSVEGIPAEKIAEKLGISAEEVQDILK